LNNISKDSVKCGYCNKYFLASGINIHIGKMHADKKKMV
jgi:hypothetical protein